MARDDILKNGSFSQLVISMCLPTVLVVLVLVIYNMADIFFIGQTGNADMVTAIALAGPFYTILAGLATLLGSGGSIAISTALGQGNYSEVRKIAGFCTSAAVILGLLVMILSTFFGKQIVTILGADASTASYTLEYIRITGFGAPLILLASVQSNLIRSDGSAKITMYGNTLGTLINIILDPLLILLFALGVRGAAIATVLGNAASYAYYSWHILKHQPILSFGISDCLLPFQRVFHFLGLGLPSAVSIALGSFTAVYSNHLMIQYGNAVLAANAIAGKASLVISMLTMGISLGIQPVFAYNFGATNYRRLRKIIKQFAILTVVVSTVLTIVYWIFKRNIAGFFIDDPVIIKYSTWMMTASLIFAPIIGLFQLSVSFLQGTGKLSYALPLSIIKQGVLLLPVMYLFNKVGSLDLLIYAQPVTGFIATGIGVLLSVMWIKSYEKQRTSAHTSLAQ